MSKLIPIIFLIAFGSCEENYENGNYLTIKEEDFQNIAITSEKYYFEEIINPSNIGLVDSKLK